MRPVDAVIRALTHRSPKTMHGVTKRTLGELEHAHGGPKGAASAAGVSRETWRRWMLGTQKPKASSVEKMEAAVRAHRLSQGRRQRLATQKPTMHIQGDMRVSNDVRNRSLDKDDLGVSSAQMAALLEAYDRGDDAMMEHELEQILGNYVPGMTVDDVDSLHIGYEPWEGSEGEDDE